MPACLCQMLAGRSWLTALNERTGCEAFFLLPYGLGIVMLAMMLVACSAQCAVGFASQNQELIEHGEPSIQLSAYLVSGDFWSATPENWESEVLQMGVYVLLTVWLRQKGSAESRPLDDAEEDTAPTPARLPPRAWGKGAIVRWLYANSLSIAFPGCFFVELRGPSAGQLAEAHWGCPDASPGTGNARPIRRRPLVLV